MAESVNNQQDIILHVENLKQHFPITQGILHRAVGHIRAVDGVSLDIHKGETLGLVGESGCGKTTLGRTILQLYKPTEGDVYFEGRNLLELSPEELRRTRKGMQIIFQDPYASLNPRMTVGTIIGEPLQIHGVSNTKERQEIVEDLLERVGLNPLFASRYPHEFSGGQRQRIGIARALALHPSFIVCDEPISALDVSIQAQIVNLLQDLQEEFGLTYLFITHDLGMVRHICDRVAVMYLGKVVELAESETLYTNPLHPYTKALLSAVPVPDPVVSETLERMILQGDVPSPANPPTGCNFNTRCPLASEKCFESDPELIEVEPGHWVSCFAIEENWT